MGLGKTAQSIAVMAWLKQYAGVTAPFVVVAPLTTLGHWQREIQTWTGMVRACRNSNTVYSCSSI
jgi:chromodomain-helicase-DNA-binding protein 7